MTRPDKKITIGELVNFYLQEFIGTDIQTYDSNLLGMELEVEFINTINPVALTFPRNWRITLDGSLRNVGYEFVLETPKELNQSLDHLNLLMDVFERPEATPLIADKDASRAGYHVHLNATHMTPKQLVTSVCVYWIIEDALTFMCGKLREGSVFCMRLSDAPRQARYLLNIVENRDAFGMFNRFLEDHMKYASLNLYTLLKFGTLEIRTMRGILDRQLLTAWTQLCYDIIYNHKFSDPSHVLQSLWDNKENSLQFLLDIIGDNPYIQDRLTERWKDDQSTLSKMMLDNANRLLPIAFEHSDWDTWSDNVTLRQASKRMSSRSFEQRPAFPTL